METNENGDWEAEREKTGEKFMPNIAH